MRRATEITKLIFGKRHSTFERYTENARRTIFFARREALQVGSDLIKPGHIVLGLCRDAWFMGEIMKGCPADDLRNQVVASLPAPRESRKEVDLPLSNESKRALAYAGEEADALLDSHLGDEHLLLGLLRQEHATSGGVLTVVLTQQGLDLKDVRSRIRGIPRENRRRHGGAQAERWREAGIPDGYTISQLLYNPIAETLVLELKGLEKDFHPKRLLVRHRTAERYEQIGDPDDDTSYESPVTCEKHPLIVFNCKKFHKAPDGNFKGADWEGTYIFNLEDKGLSLCLSKDNFLVPAPYDERGWISEILSLTDDGSYAYVKAGLGKRHNDGDKVEVRYDYYVARIDLQTGKLELISHLKNTFF